MAINNIVKIYRSNSSISPSSLDYGVLAFSDASKIVYIGDEDNQPVRIGGELYFGHAPGILTANAAYVPDANSYIDRVLVEGVRIASSGNTTAPFIQHISNSSSLSLASHSELATSLAIKTYVDNKITGTVNSSAAGNGSILVYNTDENGFVGVDVTGVISIDVSGNTTITDYFITNTHISNTAAIARSKISSGTANFVVINDGSGNLAEEQRLSPLRGGTGLDSSSAANGTLLIGTGNGFQLSTLTGTSNEIEITNASGDIVIGLPNNIDVTANLTVGQNLSVSGNTNIASNTFFVDISNQRIGIRKIPSVNFDVAGNSAFSGTVSVGGLFTLQNSANITGSVAIGNTLTVTRSAVFSNTVSITGATEVTNRLTVSGNVAIDTNLFVVDSVNDTISITGNVSSTKSISISGDLNANNAVIQNDLTVSGNLSVSGVATFFDTETISTGDSLFKFAANNSGDVVDIGFYGRFNNGDGNRYAALFRDADDGRFKFFTNLTSEPTTTINVSNGVVAVLLADLVSSNVAITGGTISGITDISVADGGTGLSSFTNQGVFFASNTTSIGFATGSTGQVLQISANGEPTFGIIDGGTF